jgi:hypothetical protein
MLTQRSDEVMICFASYKKNRHISVFSVTKPKKNFVVVVFTYVSESSALWKQARQEVRQHWFIV